MNQNGTLCLNDSANGLQQVIFAIRRRCISHGIRIIITTIANNTTNTLNIGRRPHKATIQEDIHYDEFWKVCLLLLLRKEVVTKAVQSLQQIVARKNPSNLRCFLAKVLLSPLRIMVNGADQDSCQDIATVNHSQTSPKQTLW
jgi:hypothetical protein